MNRKSKIPTSETSPPPVSQNMSRRRKRSSLVRLLPALFVLAGLLFMGNLLKTSEHKERILKWKLAIYTLMRWNMCKVQCRPPGTEALPWGIVSNTSDLDMKPLWGSHRKKKPKQMNLLAMAIGIKQKESVNKIIKKFPSNEFLVMLFHYDGTVDDWREFEWSETAIHVSVMNQTKWWFAKRFLHPDIVSEYSYIFLWDEDLGVENFHAKRYLSIIREEELEISQPALDPEKSELHHPITARDSRSRVHRRTYKTIGRLRCSENSTGPPCTGFVEMMAPVFSRAAWRCAWYMIQNDLNHGWGLDFQLGYCAQGDRTKNIGVVDSEYLLHSGLPTLGGLATEKAEEGQSNNLATSEHLGTSSSQESSGRSEVRRHSYVELEIFKNRWKKAVKEDDCWRDPFI